MKKAIVTVLAAVVMALGVQTVKAQRHSGWYLSTGIGVDFNEAVNAGFAQQVDLGYRINKFFSVEGFYNHALTQSSEYAAANCHYYGKSDQYFYMISRTETAEAEQYTGHSNVFGVAGGFNPLGFLKNNTRHYLTLKALLGVGFQSRYIIYADREQGDKGLTVNQHMGFSYAAGLDYEYMINSRVGVGASAAFDFGMQSLNGLGHLTVHF